MLTAAAAGERVVQDPNEVRVQNLWKLASTIKDSARDHFNIVPLHRGRINSYHICQYAGNPSIEDTYAIRPVLKSDGGSLFGVFDGHSGTAASQFCKNELFDYFEWYYANGYTNDLLAAAPVLHADDHFLKLALIDHRPLDGLSGACLLATHIKGDVVRTASAGDCRAVVGRRRVPSTTQGGSTTLVSSVEAPLPAGDIPANQFYSPYHSVTSHDPVELSVVHQIDLNAREKERLLSQHPNEPDILRSDRVKGALQPTRGFGDGPYKRNDYFRNYWRRSVRYDVWTPPYTTAEPDITQYTIQPNDEFIVLASDGLYQDLTPADVVHHVGTFLNDPGLRKRHSNNAGAYLIERALLAAAEHAVGRRDSPERSLTWITQVPITHRRSLHDDITVIVVFLDSPEAAKKNASDLLTGKVDPSTVLPSPSLKRVVDSFSQAQSTETPKGRSFL